MHGTDLLIAERNDTQRETLQQVARACHRIVVPTAAMGDRLRRLCPSLPANRLVHIPWGVPHELFAAAPGESPPRRDGSFEMLYAGRLTEEKGFASLLEAVAAVPDVHLSVAAPEDEFAWFRPAVRAHADAVTYLGWLDRRTLWSAFSRYDCLAVPSSVLEAFGLVAVEAQASGLPVIYQPVPGLREVLADSAYPIDMTDVPAFALELARLRADRDALKDLRAAGLRNARRFPVARTVAELARLSAETA